MGWQDFPTGYNTPRYGHEEGQDPDMEEFPVYGRTYEDEVRAIRLAEGRCADCGAFDGPTHRCPWIKAPERKPVRHTPSCEVWMSQAPEQRGCVCHVFNGGQS